MPRAKKKTTTTGKRTGRRTTRRTVSERRIEENPFWDKVINGFKKVFESPFK